MCAPATVVFVRARRKAGDATPPPVKKSQVFECASLSLLCSCLPTALLTMRETCDPDHDPPYTILCGGRIMAYWKQGRTSAKQVNEVAEGVSDDVDEDIFEEGVLS